MSDPSAPSFKVFNDRLENQLRVVTVELPHLHSASLSVFVRVGSRFESTEDNGLSHLTEHMLFRGTRRLPDAYALNHAVEELGGTLYAETRRDSSLFQISLHPEVVEQGLELLGEMLAEPAFGGLEVERRIVLEEMQEDLDVKGRDVNLSDILCDAVWSGHPLGQKITGPLRNVRRFSEDDLRRHFARHYGASNMVLCVSGAVRRDEVSAWARRAMAGLPVGEQHEVAPPEVRQVGAQQVHRDGDPGVQSSLIVGFRTFGEQDADYTALQALIRILDDGMSSRLYQRVVNELGLAYYVSAGLDSFFDTGLFELDATTVHASVPSVLREMLALVQDLRERPVPQAELQKVHKRYRWDLLSLCDDPASMAEWWARTALYTSPLDLDTKIKRMRAVGPGDIQRVAQRIFQPDNLTIGTVGQMGARVKRLVRELVAGFR